MIIILIVTIYLDETQIECSLPYSIYQLNKLYIIYYLLCSQKILTATKIWLFKKDNHIYGYSQLSVAILKIFLTFCHWQLIVSHLATYVKQLLTTYKMFINFSFLPHHVANNRIIVPTIPQLCNQKFSTRNILEFWVFCLCAVANNRKSIAYWRHTYC